jgi:hypothetical protein
MASLVRRPNSSAWYIQFYENGKLQRQTTGTDSYRVAQTRLHDFEVRKDRGDDLNAPTVTPIAEVIGRYVSHIRLRKHVQTDTSTTRQTDLTTSSRATGERAIGFPLHRRAIACRRKTSRFRAHGSALV